MSQKEQIFQLLDRITGLANNMSEEQLEGLYQVLKSEIKKLDEKDSKTSESQPLEDTGEVFHIWSDGACSGNPGPGGWGTLLRHAGNEIELSGYSPDTTNNIMEMTAAIKGLEKTPAGSTVILTTDSQYLLNGITKWIIGWKRKGWKKADGKPVLNRELWIKLDKLCAERQVDWKWVKGHSQHPENERCDFLATQAVKNRR